MYPPITLYPNGAFMVCESVAEFDENLPEKPIIDAPVPQQGDGTPRIDAVARTGALTIDPVAKLSSRLGDIYHGGIQELMTMTYGFENPDEGSHKAERISGVASESINALRVVLAKYSAIADMFKHVDPAVDIFQSHIREFIQNREKVKQQGIESYSYDFSKLEGLEPWRLEEMLAGYMTNPALLEKFISSVELGAVIQSGNDFNSKFSGLVDFLKCFFDDPARLVRLERTCHGSIDFDYFVGYHEELGDCNRPSVSSARTSLCALNRFMSMNLRDISIRCYDLQTQILDGTLTSESFAPQAAALMNRVVNIFAIGTIAALSYAYLIRTSVAQIEATKVYTEKLLNVIRNV